jgi:carboxyl-terminal processing protease
MDGNSASASEIVAACLQDHERGFVVGSRSYGKGTVQNVLPLEYGRSALRLTVARYYRPNGKNIHRKQDATEEDEWGVSPDDGLAIELDEEHLAALSQRWREASYPSLIGHTPRFQPEMEDEPENNTEAEGELQDSDAKQDKEIPAKKSEADSNAGEGSDQDSGPASQDKVTSSPANASDSKLDRAPSTIRSGLLIDPQLRRAVEKIREEIEAKKPVTTAA